MAADTTAAADARMRCDHVRGPHTCVCFRDGSRRPVLAPGPGRPSAAAHGLPPPPGGRRAHSVPLRPVNHGQQRRDPAPSTAAPEDTCPGQKPPDSPSAVASQAERASSILVTRSMMRPQVSDLGSVCCWRIPRTPTRRAHEDRARGGHECLADATQPPLTFAKGRRWPEVSWPTRQAFACPGPRPAVPSVRPSHVPLRLKATADQVPSADGTSVPGRSRKSGRASDSTRNALWRTSGQTARKSHRSRVRIASKCGARSARGPQDRRGRPAGTAVWPSSRCWGLGAFVGMSSADGDGKPRPSRRRRSRRCDRTVSTATVRPGRVIPVVGK